jgi:hypothetical protein
MADWDVVDQQPAPSAGGGWDVVSHAPSEPPPSVAADVAKSAGTYGAKGLIDFAGLPGDAANALARGSQAASDFLAESLGFDKGPAPTGPLLPTSGGIQKTIERGTGKFYEPKTTPGKYVGAAAETLTNPASYIGPGGLLSKAAMAAASGIGGEGAAQAAEGTGYEGLARFAGSMGAGPLAARVMKPQLAPAQQMLADRGLTQMTPGQLTGGLLKDLEDKASSLPILGHFIQNARGRSIEGFNRAVADQALEPIGQALDRRTAAGHDTITEVGDKLSAAYDRVLPNLLFTPDHGFASDLANIQRSAQAMPAQYVRLFNRTLNDRLQPGRWTQQQLLPPNIPNPNNVPALPPQTTWHLQGDAYKSIESELTHLAGKYGSSSDAGQQLLGDRLGDVVKAMRANLERSNPTFSDELGRINQGWAMYARMRGAATNRRGSEGVFTPGDLLTAIKRGDKSVQKGSFARGDALMQDFAEAGQRVLPSKVPDSGTAGRSLFSAAGLGYLSPKALAGVGAASVPYLRPSMWLANRYVRPTAASPGLDGLRARYSDVGRGAGMLRPFLQGPFGQSDNPYGQ